MARHWGDFLNIYLLPLFKSLELQPTDLTEVSLVVYYTRSAYRYFRMLSGSLPCQRLARHAAPVTFALLFSLCRLERSDWVSSWKEVNSLLTAAHISGGGNSESCLPGQISLLRFLLLALLHLVACCTTHSMVCSSALPAVITTRSCTHSGSQRCNFCS